MGYRDKQFDMGDRVDHELSFTGEKKKGEVRAKKSKITQEQIKKQNQYNRIKAVDRKIYVNFKPGKSTYATLTYTKELRPTSWEELKKDKEKFLRQVRREYKKHFIEFKWIIRAEVGKRGAVHIHILMNDIPGVNMVQLVAKYWKKGRPNLKPVDDTLSGKLAEYFTKLSPDEIKGQETWMDEKMQKAITMYSCSRNLDIPQPKKKNVSRRKVEDMIRNGIKPKKGFAVLADSVIYGINPFTGLYYIHYKEIRINPKEETKRHKLPGKEEKPPWER